MSAEGLSDSDVVAGNIYNKYESASPVARRLMKGFLDQFLQLARMTGAREAHEVGCGEGYLSILLARAGLEVRASDLSPVIVEQARAMARSAGISVTYQVAAIDDLQPRRDQAELVVCCEVLEHLRDPEGAVEILAGLARPYLLASVPREPLWRVLNVARGSYLSAWGNTPGHLQHWSKRAFRQLLEKHFEILELRSPLPWTMALARSKGCD